MDDTDAAVMLASCDHPARFAEVFERHHRAVWTYPARLAGPDVADDLAGEVFVAAFARRHHFDPGKGELRGRPPMDTRLSILCRGYRAHPPFHVA